MILDPAVLEMRRLEAGGVSEREPGNLNDEDFGRVFSELVRSGAIILADDDENDPDYQPEQDEEDEEPEGEEAEGEGLDAEIEYSDQADDDDDDEDNIFGYGWSLPTESHGKWHDAVKEPSPEGLSLLYSGQFGRIKHQTRSRNKDNNVARVLLNRGSKLRPIPKEDIAAVCSPFVLSELCPELKVGFNSKHKWHNCCQLYIERLCWAIFFRLFILLYVCPR
jgi:DDB1- and CUL4-associated factor 11